MAVITRVHGSGRSLAGDVHYPGAFAFKILVKIANGTAVDLRAEDDALDETVTVVCDSSASAADLQHRIRTIGGGWTRSTGAYAVSAVGPNNIDTSGSLVTLAATLTAT